MKLFYIWTSGSGDVVFRKFADDERTTDDGRTTDKDQRVRLNCRRSYVLYVPNIYTEPKLKVATLHFAPVQRVKIAFTKF